MRKTLIGLTLVMLLGAGCAPAAQTGSSNTPATTNQPVASGKFVDQPYYKNAYLISGPTMDAQAKQATAGFAIAKKDMSDGTTQYNLKALKSEYKDQVYVLRPGQKLYFIELFPGDDDVQNNKENGMRDDMAVVVNADGTVVGAPVPWTK
jgi:hypothetical protein